ncbi:MAG: adenylate/guanylate cyclase domain-containing protein [Leptospirales bacterium]|nr:adenylate/guanylate cyclase domain-containing protein [Leptospirales bacterium]
MIQFSVYMVLIVVMRTIGRFLAGDYTSPGDILRDSYTVEAVFVAAIAALVLNFLVYVTALLDLPTILAFLSGRYHRPRREDRVFLFVDLVGSTTIAEEIGGEKFALMLDRFFSDMTEALILTGGAIYKYVGDEAIITWPLRDTSGASCLRFHALLKTEIEKNRMRYESEFGRVPQFRAAAHAGEVVASEIGTLKKEIAFLGDTVNVTARLLEESRKAEGSFVISGGIRDLLSSASKDELRSMGRMTVRGRIEPVEVYSVIEEMGTIKKNQATTC